jgi:hypothetical protein
MPWVTKTVVMAECGYTDGQIKSRIQRGHWRRGIEFADVDGARLYNLEAIDAKAQFIAESQRGRIRSMAQGRVVKLR